MEQQKLFPRSETSGLLNLDLDKPHNTELLESNTFLTHRNTIFDILVQIQCSFGRTREDPEEVRSYEGLKIVLEPFDSDGELKYPAKDSSSAHVPLSESRKALS
jgi:hypothetical protein